MKKVKYIVIVLVLLSFSMSSKRKRTINSKWVQNPIIVDGNVSEWTQSPHFYNSDTKFFVSIANDSSNLYLNIVTSDELIQTKILRSGLIVSVDTLGKKNEHISVKYPVKDSKRGKQLMTKKGKPNLNDIKKTFNMRPQFMTLSGFNSGNGTGLLQNKNGVIVKLDWDENNNLVYELKLPFLAFGKEILTIEALENKYSLIVKLPAVTKPKIDGTTGATKPSGGRPSGAPGGGNGAGRPSNMGQMSVVFEEQYFLQKFTFTLN